MVLHGELRDKSAQGGVIGLTEAANKNIDYMALGHYHTYSEAQIDKRGVAVYSGTPEGRGGEAHLDKAGGEESGARGPGAEVLPPRISRGVGTEGGVPLDPRQGSQHSHDRLRMVPGWGAARGTPGSRGPRAPRGPAGG